MAGEMDLADRRRRQCVEIGDRVELEVGRADVDVVDVAEDAATGRGRFRPEFRLGNGRMAKAQVGGRVLISSRRPSVPAPRLCALAEDIQALLGVGKRQQVVQ